jgi:hypothetical protein
MEKRKMCDCYEANCKICGIGKLPIHLGDWETNHHEIEVYCGSHIPPTDCRIFVTKAICGGRKRGWKVGIRALTENAKKNKDRNIPNIRVDFVVVDI